MFCSQILDTRLSLIILLFKVLVFVFVGFGEFPLCFPALVGSRFEAVCLYDALVFSLSWFIIADCIINVYLFTLRPPCVPLLSASVHTRVCGIVLFYFEGFICSVLLPVRLP